MFRTQAINQTHQRTDHHLIKQPDRKLTTHHNTPVYRHTQEDNPVNRNIVGHVERQCPVLTRPQLSCQLGRSKMKYLSRRSCSHAHTIIADPQFYRRQQKQLPPFRSITAFSPRHTSSSARPLQNQIKPD